MSTAPKARTRYDLRHQVNRTLTLALTALLSGGLSMPLSAQSPFSQATAGPRTLMQTPMGDTRNAPQHVDVLEEIQNLQQDRVGISEFRAEYKNHGGRGSTRRR